MAQGNVTQASGHSYTTSNTGLKYRTTNTGNPLAHNDVDANFELLRAAVNGIVSDIDGVVDKDVLTNVPSGAVFTDTVYTLPAATASTLGGIKVGANLSVDSAGTLQGAPTYTHPNHTGDVTSTGDGATVISDGAVTGTKIANNSITTEQLVTEGNNSISLTQVVPKTLVIHVGNYYDRTGTQRLASDALNYNTGSDTYGLRTVNTIAFSEGPDGWFSYHYDSEQAETVEPFATCVAAIRYALHNFGSGAYLQLVIHGHVSWHGSYDMVSATSASIKDARQMDMFAGFAMTPGAPGTYSGSNSAYVTYPTVTARVDVQCDGVNSTAPGMWFRGPRCMWSGINLVFQKTDSGDIGIWWSKSTAGFHEARGMRYASLDQPTGQYFYPFHWIEGANGFVSSGANQPLEFYISRNCTVFNLSGGSSLLTSNNATSNNHFFEGQHAGIGVRYSGCSGRSSMTHKYAQVYLKSGSSFDRTINTFGMVGGFNEIGVWPTPSTLHVPGNGTMQKDANAIAHSIYNLDATISATNLSYTGNPTGGLYSKWGVSSYVSALTALSPSRLTSNASFKAKPTTRATDPYSDQK